MPQLFSVGVMASDNIPMTDCRACRSDRLTEVFAFDRPMPLAGAFAATADEARAMPKYPLAWLLCEDCGLVNVTPDIPDDLIYRTYSYAASTVPALVRHHTEFAATLVERYPKRGVTLLDIGCNDGVLLDRLPGDNWSLVGVDPSDVSVAANPPTWFPATDWTLVNEPFGGKVASEWEGYFDVVTSSNAFAHFTDIAGALDGVARILRPGGDFWIEVHDLAATLRGAQWDTIYHEHKVEWSLSALAYNAWMRDLHLIDHWRLPLHGGLIRALFRKGPEDGFRNPEPRLTDVSFALFRDRYERRRPPALMEHSAAYGAAARATVYLNQMWPLPIDYVVDSSPLRAGKYVPGIGIPVLPPEVFDADRPDTTLVTAWNHAGDIARRHPGYEGWVAAW